MLGLVKLMEITQFGAGQEHIWHLVAEELYLFLIPKTAQSPPHRPLPAIAQETPVPTSVSLTPLVLR